MAKLYGKKLAAWERKRDINAEILQAARDMRRGNWARKTEFIPQRDGSMRRIITRRDGTVEKDHIIPAGDTSVRAARAATGLSQARFASLLGVSVRTLQEWEQGRKSPSGAAATLLRIAGKRPDVLKELA
jgi:putative transcriptional regulator